MGFELDMISRDRSVQFCWMSRDSVQGAWILMQIWLDFLELSANFPHPLSSLPFCGGNSGYMHHYFSEAIMTTTIAITIRITIAMLQQRWCFKISFFFSQGVQFYNLPLIPGDSIECSVSPVSSQLTFHIAAFHENVICQWDGIPALHEGPLLTKDVLAWSLMCGMLSLAIVLIRCVKCWILQHVQLHMCCAYGTVPVG